MPTLIKQNYKTIIATTVFIIGLPILNLMVHMLYSYGTYVGTFIRSIVENGACF